MFRLNVITIKRKRNFHYESLLNLSKPRFSCQVPPFHPQSQANQHVLVAFILRASLRHFGHGVVVPRTTQPFKTGVSRSGRHITDREPKTTKPTGMQARSKSPNPSPVWSTFCSILTPAHSANTSATQIKPSISFSIRAGTWSRPSVHPRQPIAAILKCWICICLRNVERPGKSPLSPWQHCRCTHCTPNAHGNQVAIKHYEPRSCLAQSHR